MHDSVQDDKGVDSECFVGHLRRTLRYVQFVVLIFLCAVHTTFVTLGSGTCLMRTLHRPVPRQYEEHNFKTSKGLMGAEV